jgi:hypothetical protein
VRGPALGENKPALNAGHRNCGDAGMKKMIFFSFALLATFAGVGQEIGTDGAPVIVSNPDHSAFLAYLGINNVVQMRWGRSVNDEIDHFVVGHSTDGSFFDPLHQLVAKNGIDADSVYEDADAFPANPVNYGGLPGEQFFVQYKHNWLAAGVIFLSDQ